MKDSIKYQGKIFSVVEKTATGKSGQEHKHQSVVHPGAVVIVPFTADNKIIFVKQYRPSVGQSLIELPAGTIEETEDPFTCAQRELQEEIQYRSNELTLCGGCFSTPGFCNEYLYFFIAKQLLESPLMGDDTEEITTTTLTLEEAENHILSHQIIDAKTICGLFFLKKWLMSTP